MIAPLLDYYHPPVNATREDKIATVQGKIKLPPFKFIYTIVPTLQDKIMFLKTKKITEFGKFPKNLIKVKNRHYSPLQWSELREM